MSNDEKILTADNLNEFLVERVNKYNIDVDKKNKNIKYNLFMFGLNIIFFLNAYVHQDTITHNTNELIATLFQVMPATIVIGTFIVSTVAIMRKMGLHGRIKELESIIEELSKSNEKSKGMRK